MVQNASLPLHADMRVEVWHYIRSGIKCKSKVLYPGSGYLSIVQSALRKRNGNTEYFAEIQYDFQKDKPKTISEIHSKGIKSSRLSYLMRLKVH